VADDTEAEQAMNAIKPLLERLAFVLIAVAITAVFHVFGGFGEPGSILFGVSFTLVAVWLYELLRLAVFKPYRITIYVNFDAIRDDLGLLKTDRPPDPYEPMYDVYEFTAINPALFAHYKRYTGGSATEFKLADRYARSYEEYRSVIAFWDGIPCAVKQVQYDMSTNLDPHPIFFFRPGRDGYQFGIQVVPEWWSEHCKQLSAHVHNLPISYDRTIVLGLLPYGYIPDHVQRWHETVNLLYPFDRKQRQWKARLAKHDWTITENEPSELDHRYLHISYSNI
jgi:hypothetical protein